MLKKTLLFVIFDKNKMETSKIYHFKIVTQLRKKNTFGNIDTSQPL